MHRDWKKTWISDVCWILIHRDGYNLMNSDVFCLVFLLAREYTTRGCRCIRGKLSEIHRDWYELSNSDVFWLVLPACAGVYCEREQVASREIN